MAKNRHMQTSRMCVVTAFLVVIFGFVVCGFGHSMIILFASLKTLENERGLWCGLEISSSCRNVTYM